MNQTINNIRNRQSIRAFTNQTVDINTVKEILSAAARAPSGTNMQPWQVHVLTGAPLKKATDDIQKAFFDPDFQEDFEYQYYPDPFFEPYKTRRKTLGLALYGILDIKKGEIEKMQKQHARNFNFFDAPVGLFFTIHKALKMGSWLDYGMFLQNIMIAAKSYGLDTCPQAAFAGYHKIIRNHIDMSKEDALICGMALGFKDETAPENRLESERSDLNEFAKFYDQ